LLLETNCVLSRRLIGLKIALESQIEIKAKDECQNHHKG